MVQSIAMTAEGAPEVVAQPDISIFAPLNQSEGTTMRMQTAAERQAWKAEFHPKIKASIVEKSSDPDETLAMIQKIEDLVKDLEWR